jgi:copper chaperone CopZ
VNSFEPDSISLGISRRIFVDKTIRLLVVNFSVLAALCVWTGLAFGQQGKNQSPGELPPGTAVFTVKGMCCSKESGPAIAALSKIPGVAKVVASHKAGTLTIYRDKEKNPSPVAIWEAVEGIAKVEPIKLATAQGTFTAKPKLK